MSDKMYTQDQLDIALLKNSQEGILKSISDIRTDLQSGMSELRAEIKSQGHLNLGLVLGIYAMIGAAGIGKIFGVL